MEHLFSGDNIWILEADQEAIRSALIRSGYSKELTSRFFGSGLRTDFEGWEVFVTTDWSNWDISEYDHDIGRRYWIQVVIENSCAETRSRIEAEVKPLDDLFLNNMRLLRSPRISRGQLPLSSHPYFWETGTIHPDHDVI